MFLFDRNVYFLLIGLYDVVSSGVVGNVKQLFAFCLAIINNLCKKDLSEKVNFTFKRLNVDARLNYHIRRVFYYHCW